ncbi:MAG: glycosyltransferase family 9 protein [Sediminibacterium sp.]
MLEPLMDSLLLLRSFGDFVIAINAAQTAALASQKKIIASVHLQALYVAIKPYLANQNIPIQFVDLGIERPLFSAFTNRYLISKQSVKELRALKKMLENNKSIFYLEQSRRLLLLSLYTQQNFKSIHSSGNIYYSYQHHFGNNHSVSIATDFPSAKNMLVFPDSRMQKKELPIGWLNELTLGLTNTAKTLTIARFGNNQIPTQLSYKNFNELVALIANADAIISSDSLPVHLAQLLHKPHAIVYANTINKEWITPYAHQEHTGFLLNQLPALLTLINAH